MGRRTQQRPQHRRSHGVSEAGRIEEEREPLLGRRSGEGRGPPHFRRIRAALHGARAHGAGKLHRLLSTLEVRTLGADAGSARLPRLRRARHRPRSRSSQGERHAHGRRLRPPSRARLRRRSRTRLESNQRSRKSDLDARRRHALLDLPSREFASTQCHARRLRLPGCSHPQDHRAFHQRTEGTAHAEQRRSRFARRGRARLRPAQLFD